MFDLLNHTCHLVIYCYAYANEIFLVFFKAESAPMVSQLIQRPTVSSSAGSGSDQQLMRVPSISDGQTRHQNGSNIPAKVDLLADFGGDPFAGSAMPTQSTGSLILFIIECFLCHDSKSSMWMVLTCYRQMEVGTIT